jgi:poly(A) polymerase
MLPFDPNIFPFKTGVYLVGGSVRDLLAGRIPYDYDLAVGHNPSDFASGLADATGGRVVELGREDQKMLRVVTTDCFFDVTPINGTTIENDLRLRDFTINAMAVDVAAGDLIDPLDGQKDLAAKTVRMVSPEAFRLDPVRLVRAYRMAAVFKFDIEQQTRSAIALDAGLIRRPASERIRDELYKILQCAESHPYLTMMAGNHLLFHILKEFNKLNQQQPQSDAFRASINQVLESYNHLEIILNSTHNIRSSFGNQPFPGDDTERSSLIKWAALIHGFSRLNADFSHGGGQFEDSAALADNSALIARSICERLRFSRRHSDTIELIIRQHIRPMGMFIDGATTSSIEKELIRLFLDSHDLTPDVLLHALAAFRGQTDEADTLSKEFTGFIQMLIRKYVTELIPRASLPSPINGNDLINEFGMAPSPEFKNILRQIEEERLARSDFTRKEALKLVSDLLVHKQPES